MSYLDDRDTLKAGDMCVIQSGILPEFEIGPFKARVVSNNQEPYDDGSGSERVLIVEALEPIRITPEWGHYEATKCQH